MDLQKTFFIFFLLISLSSATSVVDFCVADLSYPVTPAGYPCRNPANITVDDFVYSGLNAAKNVSKLFKASISAATDQTFPALNDLGLSICRVDIEVGGVVPLHSHRVSELLYVVEGTITSGFIGSDNTAYYKTLNKGDIIILPQEAYHFVINSGNSTAVTIASLNSPNPGVRIVTTSIAANNLPTDLIQKITLLDANQIQELKKIFGGTN